MTLLPRPRAGPPSVVPPLRPRPRDAHKGTMGHLLIVGGSPGLTGAVVLCARAALRCGVGCVTCAVPASLNSIIEVLCLEPMSLPLPEDGSGTLGPESMSVLATRLDRYDAIVVGPGLGRAARTGHFQRELLAALERPHVIDADALWHLAADPASAVIPRAPRVLTPHAGELARLQGTAEAPAAGAAHRVLAHPRVVLVRKGPNTEVEWEGQRYRNDTGNPGLAKGGTGDVLAGMVGAFLARGDTPWDAAVRGVWLHGRAGDHAAARLGQESVIASDVIAALPEALLELQETRS